MDILEKVLSNTVGVLVLLWWVLGLYVVSIVDATEERGFNDSIPE